MNQKICSLLMAAALVLCGCSQKVPSEQPLEQPTASLEKTLMEAGPTSADGIYRVTSPWNRKEEHVLNIVYGDRASKQMMPLCADPNCEHNTDSCTSFVPADSAFLEVVGDQLAAICTIHEQDMEQSWVMTMDLDGSNHKTVLTLAGGQVFENPIFTDGTGLYAQVKTYGQDVQKQFVRIDLQTGKMEEIVPLDTKQNEWVKGCTKDSLILYRYQAGPNGEISEQGEYGSEYCLLNLQTKERTPVFQWNEGLFKNKLQMDVRLLQDKVIWADPDDRHYHIKEIELGTETVVDSYEIKPTPREGGNVFSDVLAKKEEKLLIREQFYDSQNRSLKQRFFVLNTKTGEQKDWNLTYKEEAKGEDSAVVILGQWEDAYFVEREGYLTEAGKNNQEGVPLTGEPYRSTHSLILKEDYWNGIPNFEDFTEID